MCSITQDLTCMTHPLLSETIHLLQVRPGRGGTARSVKKYEHLHHHHRHHHHHHHHHHYHHHHHHYHHHHHHHRLRYYYFNLPLLQLAEQIQAMLPWTGVDHLRGCSLRAGSAEIMQEFRALQPRLSPLDKVSAVWFSGCVRRGLVQNENGTSLSRMSQQPIR